LLVTTLTLCQMPFPVISVMTMMQISSFGTTLFEMLTMQQRSFFDTFLTANNFFVWCW